MRKLLLGTTVTVAALSLGAVSASADVETFWDVDKLKTIDIDETITITKVVDINVTVDKIADKAAESMAHLNQSNLDNSACENCAEKRDIINNSIEDNTGIVSVNQAIGNMNNQGTVIAFAFDVGESEVGTDYGFAEAQAHVEQDNGAFRSYDRDDAGNIIPGTGVLNDEGHDVDSANILFRDSILTDSINDNDGIVYVNQSSGQLNNQGNALSIAVSLSPGVALAEADLAQLNAYSTVSEANVNKRARMENVGLGNTGVIGVNQSSGVAANQANVIALSYTGDLPATPAASVID